MRDKAQLKQFYDAQAASLSRKITTLQLRNRLFVVAELFTFAAAVGCVAAYTVYGNMLFVVGAAAAAAAYVAARRFDAANGERISRLTALRTVYSNESGYIDGLFAPFDDGRRYADPRHPFAFDMDIFGPQSLFHRINRTVTTGGSDELARRLSEMPADETTGNDMPDGDAPRDSNAERPLSVTERIARQRDIIDRLAGMEELRARFIACGQRRRIDTTAVKKAIAGVRDMPMPRWADSTSAAVVAWLSLAGFLTAIALAATTGLPSAVPTIWGSLHLFAMLTMCNKPLRAIDHTAGRLHRELTAYEELFELAGRDMSLITRGSDLKASRLISVLKGVDRRGNVLGLILFDVFLLSDFFLVRRFRRWQRQCVDDIERNIDEVSIADALVSMATFRYNEPQAGTAEIADGHHVVYEAEALWHPFLGDKAVRNDFCIADSHYYIVTGANMAGKSTFLRSLGVNYVLAMNGMPVFAERLKVSVFSLFSSMRTSDDLAHGISYFNAELLRLRQLISHCHSHRRTLIILDEILKGTNSLDKLNGSRMFLDAISQLPVSGVIATHDLELSRMADNRPDRFHNFCFEIRLADEITYTYRISPGVARNQNATHLLKKIIEEV